MYPFIRFAIEWFRYRKTPMSFDETHLSYHRCLPWDIDPFMELNNGRTLTLYDLGRVPMVVRMGLDTYLRKKGWGLTVAGSSVRYRKRIRMFDRIEMRTRILGWDKRFIYIDQTMWLGAECAGQALIRSAIFGPDGIVSPSELAQDFGVDPERFPLPAWVHAWIDADAQRVWPPEK
ncbi:MAG: acyl-CoA thioesterase [Pseudomonadota bacterium]